MDLKAGSESKPTDTATSRAAAGAKLEDLLGSAELGVLVRGVVLVSELPQEVSGVNGKGRAYKFWSRRSQVFTGEVSGTVVVSEVADKPEDFRPLHLYREAVYSIEGCRMDGRQMVLRGKLKAA